MRVAVLQSNYIPWKGYFQLINEVDLFCFYDEVQYTKNDWRNRNQLLNSGGPFWLTIPIPKTAVKQIISEVNFPNQLWVKKHLMSIEQTYAKSPFKKDVIDLLSPIYENVVNLTLSEFNQQIIKAICGYAGIDTKIVNSADYSLSIGKVDRLLGLLEELNTSIYVSGPAGKNYLDSEEEKFKDKGIEIEYIKYGSFKEYGQKTDDFYNNVSIIDLLMNVPQSEVKSYIGA
jgi:hypothetical protein